MLEKSGKTIANISTDIVANATLLDLPSKKPNYLENITNIKQHKNCRKNRLVINLAPRAGLEPATN